MFANPFYLVAGLYLTVAAVAAATMGVAYAGWWAGPPALNWLRMHLVTIGTVTQVLFGTMPGLVAAKLGVPAQPRSLSWLQWALLNGGFVLLLIGMPGGDAVVAATGATVILVAVATLVSSVTRMARQAPRADRPAMPFYLTAPWFFLTGIMMAISLLLNWWAPGGRIGILEAHVHANVWGFLALVAAGTLFDFFPALVRRPLAAPNLVPATFWLITLGAAGLAIYFVGSGLLIYNLIATAWRARPNVPAGALHIITAYTWMVVPAFFAPFIVLMPDRVPAARIEASATQGLVNGWVLQMAMGAMPWILAAVARRRGDSTARVADVATLPASTGTGLLPVIGVNLGVATIWASSLVPAEPAHTLLLSGGYALIVAAWIPVLVRVWGVLSGDPEVA